MSIGTALIVDDEKNIRLTMSKCLSFINLEVDEAVNGEEGIKKIEEKQYDIVFLDLKMQGMYGLDALKIMREKRPSTPVVIVTAHGTVDAAVDAMKLGAADFMQKPFTPKEIQEIVQEILSRKKLNKESLDSYDSYLQFAKKQIVDKDYDGAMESLKDAIGLDPLKAEPHNIMGTIHEIRKEFEEAKKHYKAALALDPGYLQAQRNLVRVNEILSASSK